MAADAIELLFGLDSSSDVMLLAIASFLTLFVSLTILDIRSGLAISEPDRARVKLPEARVVRR